MSGPLSHQRLGEGFAQQLGDQTAETDTLRSAYKRLQQKLTETQQQVELLSAQLRRSRTAQKAATAQAMLSGGPAESRLAALSARAGAADAESQIARTLLAVASVESLDERFAAIEQNDEVEALLLELKQKQPRLT